MAATEALTWVDIDALVPHPDNPRVGHVPAITEAIRRNGWHGAIVVQKSTGRILAGKHRWLAAKEVGLKRVSVHYVDVDDHTALRILLADNRTSDISGYDDPKLLEVLDLIIEQAPEPAVALEGSGYTLKEAQQISMALAGGAALEYGTAMTPAEKLERYNTTTSRTIPIIMTRAEFDAAVPRLNALMEQTGLDNFSDLFLWMVDKLAPKAGGGGTE